MFGDGRSTPNRGWKEWKELEKYPASGYVAAPSSKQKTAEDTSNDGGKRFPGCAYCIQINNSAIAADVEMFVCFLAQLSSFYVL